MNARDDSVYAKSISNSSNLNNILQITKNNTEETDNPVISVIMPIYKLSKRDILSINAVEKIMETSSHRYEIVIVNERSHNETYNNVLRVFENPSIKIYRLPRNIGKGFAPVYGFKKKCGEIIVFSDGDLDLVPSQILPFIDTLNNSDTTIVITSKWYFHSEITIVVKGNKGRSVRNIELF